MKETKHLLLRNIVANCISEIGVALTPEKLFAQSTIRGSAKFHLHPPTTPNFMNSKAYKIPSINHMSNYFIMSGVLENLIMFYHSTPLDSFMDEINKTLQNIHEFVSLFPVPQDHHASQVATCHQALVIGPSYVCYACTMAHQGVHRLIFLFHIFDLSKIILQWLKKENDFTFFFHICYACTWPIWEFTGLSFFFAYLICQISYYND